MRSMFYDYDHSVDGKEYPPVQVSEPPKLSADFSGATVIRNAKGDALGVRAKVGSPFDLYFYLDGYVENGSIEELLSNESNRFFLQTFHDKSKEFIGETEAEPTDDNSLKVTIYPEYLGLKEGIYRMRLILISDDAQYTLFSEDSAILSLSR